VWTRNLANIDKSAFTLPTDFAVDEHKAIVNNPSLF